jgi:hypothetical protein
MRRFRETGAIVVKGDEIIVTTLGFYATYYKSQRQPQLILREHTKTEDYELLAEALRTPRRASWVGSCKGGVDRSRLP